MKERHRRSAETTRARLEGGAHDALAFREALLGVPPSERDAWLDVVLRLDELPDDGPDLPRDGVPYLPSSVDVLLRSVGEAGVEASDVFVDIGAGIGRAVTFVHLLTGAAAVGVEIQQRLIVQARALAARLEAPRISYVLGDAAEIPAAMTAGSVFFLYCPFSGARLQRLLVGLQAIARSRVITICCVDLPLPPCPWLDTRAARAADLAVHRSRF